MRKMLIAMLVFVFSGNVKAQGRRSDVESRLIVKAGYNIANITIDNAGNTSKSNSLGSFHIGVMSDLPVNKLLSFTGGLLFTGKGSKTEAGTPGETGYFKARTNPMYLEVPVNFVGKISLGFKNAPKIIVGAGLYGSIGITGSNNTQLQATSQTIVYTNKDIDFDGGNNYTNPIGYPVMKRFDYGLNGQAGIELKRLVFTVSYDYGFVKLLPHTDNTSDDKGKNRVLYFSAGIKL